MWPKRWQRQGALVSEMERSNELQERTIESIQAGRRGWRFWLPTSLTAATLTISALTFLTAQRVGEDVATLVEPSSTQELIDLLEIGSTLTRDESILGRPELSYQVAKDELGTASPFDYRLYRPLKFGGVLVEVSYDESSQARLIEVTAIDPDLALVPPDSNFPTPPGFRSHETIVDDLPLMLEASSRMFDPYIKGVSSQNGASNFQYYLVGKGLISDLNNEMSDALLNAGLRNQEEPMTDGTNLSGIRLATFAIVDSQALENSVLVFDWFHPGPMKNDPISNR